MIWGNPIGFDSDHQKFVTFLTTLGPTIHLVRSGVYWERGIVKTYPLLCLFLFAKMGMGKWEGATTMYIHTQKTQGD